MRVDLKITLNGGGTITLRGDELTAEDVNHLFEILAGATVTGAQVLHEHPADG